MYVGSFTWHISDNFGAVCHLFSNQTGEINIWVEYQISWEDPPCSMPVWDVAPDFEDDKKS